MTDNAPINDHDDLIASIRDALVLGLGEQAAASHADIDTDRLASVIADAVESRRDFGATTSAAQAARDGREVETLNASNDI